MFSKACSSISWLCHNVSKLSKQGDKLLMVHSTAPVKPHVNTYTYMYIPAYLPLSLSCCIARCLPMLVLASALAWNRTTWLVAGLGCFAHCEKVDMRLNTICEYIQVSSWSEKRLTVSMWLWTTRCLHSSRIRAHVSFVGPCLLMWVWFCKASANIRAEGLHLVLFIFILLWLADALHTCTCCTCIYTVC